MAQLLRQIMKWIPKKRMDQLLLAIILILFVCVIANRFSWLLSHFDLFSHFQIQYSILLAFVCFIALCRKKWWVCVIALLVLVIPFVRIFPWYIKSGQESIQPPTITILSSNVKAANQNWEAMQEMVFSADADVVVLIEATTYIQDNLTEVEKKYPYTYGHNLDTGAGFLLFSKNELLNITPHLNGVSKIVTLTMSVQTQEGVFDLVAVHPIRPGLRHGSALADAELEQISEVVQSCQKDTVVIGDLNTTMWSNSYKKFAAVNGLQNLRKGMGVMPTWGLHFMGPLLAIPIDHCFVRGNLQGVSFHTVQLDGSDHLALCVGIAVSLE
jgi:endonuclease/exonuclease/phosphatase (EEP) superfamily protein YafD